MQVPWALLRIVIVSGDFCGTTLARTAQWESVAKTGTFVSLKIKGLNPRNIGDFADDSGNEHA